MGRGLKYSGWVAACIACAMAVWAVYWGVREAHRANAADADVSALQTALANEKAQREAEAKAFESRLSAVEKARDASTPTQPLPRTQPHAASTRELPGEIQQSLVQALAAAFGAGTGPAGTPSTPSETDLRRAMEAMGTALGSGFGTAASGATGSGTNQQFLQKMMQAGLGMEVDKEYAGYFEKTALTPDAKQRARDILLSRKMDAVASLGLSAAESTGSRPLADRKQEASRKAYDELAQVLSTEQLADLKKYETEVLSSSPVAGMLDMMASAVSGDPEEMLRKSTAMEMSLYAPAMPPQLRTRIAGVLAEETGNGPGFHDRGNGLDTALVGRKEARARTRERLKGELSVQDLASMDRAFAQMEEMENMFYRIGSSTLKQQPTGMPN